MIRIAYADLDTINAEAQAAYPGECCGLLVGQAEPNGDVLITRTVASANVADPPAPDRFEVDPKIRFDLMRELEDTAELIVGHYHSHPDHPAKPSQTDIDMAFEPDMVWLITAVISGTAGRTRAWRLNRETRRVEALELLVTDDA